MYEAIKQQMIDYCDCIPKEETETFAFEKNVKRMIQVLSQLGCWTEHGCETLLKEDRVEIFDPRIRFTCGCDHGIMRVLLFYRLGVEVDTIRVQIQMREGIKFTTIDVPSECISYDEFEGALWMDLKDYLPSNCCSCEKIDKVVIRYVAGFEKLPDCILDVACDILRMEGSINDCSCSCTECDMDNADIQVVEEADGIRTQDDLIKAYILRTYAKVLATISLCHEPNRFLGMVV